MSISAKRNGDQLVITVELAKSPYRSKSAVAKALAKGQDESTVAATMLGGTSGFERFGDVKLSLNIIKA